MIRRSSFQFLNVFVLLGVVCSGCRHAAIGPAGTTGLNPGGTLIVQGAPKISIRAMDRRIPVIMYHDVLPERGPGSVWFDATTAEFAQQMAWIDEHGYQPISVDDLYKHLTSGAEVPRRSIVLTFDDNYRGFYDNALPILKRYNYPAIMFVHTNYVGDDRGEHPKMTWDQLKELSQGKLVTIGAHTLSHPEDITKLPEAEQEKEIVQSKKILEQHLGKPVEFFAYPNGKYDKISEDIARKAGFKLSFTINSGLAEESPDLQAIHRYEHLKLPKAIDDAEQVADAVPAAVVEQDFTQAPVTLTVAEFEGLKIGLVKGGKPESYLSNSREGVADIVEKGGAAAGINGGFFTMAGLNDTSNVMIGPTYPGNTKTFSCETSPRLLAKLRNRPVVMWSGSKLAIFPFQPDTINDEEAFRRFMPDFTDIFVAGAWMVHDGVARNDEEMMKYASKDIDDVRRRAFFGWTASGESVVGASLQTCTTERLAEAAAAAGVQEAVLLDSGFSTSLVFNGRIVVTGHTARNLASRPVPHAILLMGDLDLSGADAMLASAAEGARSPDDIEGEKRAIERRRLRRAEALKRKSEEEANPPLATPNGEQAGLPGISVNPSPKQKGGLPPPNTSHDSGLPSSTGRHVNSGSPQVR